MNTSGKVSHKGTVMSVSDKKIMVHITSESACAACHAKSMCSLSEMKEKSIAVPLAGRHFEAGEEVLVSLNSSVGLRAVWRAYLLPLLILLVILLSLLNIPVSEGLSALFALFAVALYYALLWRFRNKYEKRFVFEIEKLN